MKEYDISPAGVLANTPQLHRPDSEVSYASISLEWLYPLQGGYAVCALVQLRCVSGLFEEVWHDRDCSGLQS